MQSCLTTKPIFDYSHETDDNGIRMVIVENPQMKTRASIFSWLFSIALVPCYGIGLIPMIFSATSSSKNNVESDEAAKQWASLYGKKNKTKYIVIPSNKSNHLERNSKWVWVKDYSEMKLTTTDAELKFIASKPSDVDNFKALFPNSTYCDSFIKRTALSADEPTLLKLIELYPSSTEIDFAKKRYILLAKYYNEFNSRLDAYKVKSTVLSKDEIIQKASSLASLFENVSDFLSRYGFNTIYNDQIFGQTLASSGWSSQKLETLISWFPNSKHKESAISLLVRNTQDINTLNSYLTRFSGSSNTVKINEKINLINDQNQSKLLAEEQKIARFKESGDYKKDYEVLYVGYSLMASNLDVTHFRNGDEIKKAQTDDEWAEAIKNEIPAYCDHPYGAKYGKLYNFYAFGNTSKELAPEGWRKPTLHEWDYISEYMKKNKTNNSLNDNFAFLKGGYRTYFGQYWDFEKYAIFWAEAREKGTLTSLIMPSYGFKFYNYNKLNESLKKVLNGESTKLFKEREAPCTGGLSVRLIKD